MTHDHVARSDEPLDTTIWTTEPDMQLRGELIDAHGGWPTDPRPLAYRVGDVLGTYVLIAIACGAVLLLLHALGVPIS